VKTLLSRFGMTDAKPVRLPIGARTRLERAGELLTGEDPNIYQELVGCLDYLATATRPDIAFAVGWLSRFVSAPTVAHLAAGKMVLRYLSGTKTTGLCYQREGDLMRYNDANFAADKDTRRSTSGNVFMFKGAAVSWVSNRGCHGYIPEEYIHALYPYPLRIRAGDAYSKCIMRKRGEDISILSDKNCKIISDPYSRYERQDTGIY